MAEEDLLAGTNWDVRVNPTQIINSLPEDKAKEILVDTGNFQIVYIIPNGQKNGASNNPLDYYWYEIYVNYSSPQDVTTKELLSTIYDFYQGPVEREDIQALGLNRQDPNLPNRMYQLLDGFTRFDGLVRLPGRIYSFNLIRGQ